MRTATARLLLIAGSIPAFVLGCGGGTGDGQVTPEAGGSATEATTPTQTPVPATPTPVAPRVEELALTASTAALQALRQGKAPDPAQVATTFPTGTSLTVAIRLDAAREPGLRSAWVEARVTRNGVLARRSTFLARRGGWSGGDLAIHGSGGTLDLWTQAPPGDYELTVTVLPGGDSKTVKFALTAGPREAQMGAPDPGGASNFDAAITTEAWGYLQPGEPNGLPTDARREWRVETLQPYLQTAFPAGAEIGVLLNSNLARAGKETVTWKFQGKELGPPELTVPVAGSIWSAYFGFAHAPGEYEAVLTGSGTSRTLKFQILPMGQTPGGIEQAGLFALQGATTPEAAKLATTLNAWDRVLVAFSASPPAASQSTPTQSAHAAPGQPWQIAVKYAGAEVARGPALLLGSWWTFEPKAALSAGSALPLPTGTYQAIITNLATGDTKTLSFGNADEEGRTPTPASGSGAASPGSSTPRPTP